MADFCGFWAKIGVLGCFFACAKGVGGMVNRKFVIDVVGDGLVLVAVWLWLCGWGDGVQGVKWLA